MRGAASEWERIQLCLVLPNPIDGTIVVSRRPYCVKFSSSAWGSPRQRPWTAAAEAAAALHLETPTPSPAEEGPTEDLTGPILRLASLAGSGRRRGTNASRDSPLCNRIDGSILDCVIHNAYRIDLAGEVRELCRKIGDGVNQAADLISATASIPSLNFIPLTTFGNWF